MRPFYAIGTRRTPAFKTLCLISLAASTCIGAEMRSDGPLKKAGADEGLRKAFERAEYSVKDEGHGTYRGENPAQRLTLDFDGQGARLSHPEGSLNFHLAGYGYGDRLQKPAHATLTGNGNRLEYQRGGLTEWYLNGPQGLEQGFTLTRRSIPENATNREPQPLVIALGVTGELVPAQEAGEDSVMFESSKGVVLRYAGLKAVDARGRILPSRMEVRGHEIRLIVEDQDAQYPLIIDPIWTQQQELTASDGTVANVFGVSVSVSGDTAVIGAYGNNSNQGAAYVFVRSGGTWSLQQELTASDGAPYDQFGASVSVSGDTAVVGAFDKNFAQGAAYVFARSSGVWTQQQELTASDGAVTNEFGCSVSVSGNTAVIGACRKNSYQGAAYVFVNGGATWSQQQELTASGGVAGDEFGVSVSVSGNTAVIGANGQNSGKGAAYLFVQSAGVWSQQQELTASDGVANDYFGMSVSVSGNTAVIGAFGKNIGQGAAYVFMNGGGVWSQEQELTASDGTARNGFGSSVSVSGDAAVIGAYEKNSNQGAAYLFVQSAGVWSQQQELTASDGVANDSFGISVSVSGSTVVIGAPVKTIGSNSDQGAAYVFVRPRLGTNTLLVGSAGGSSSVVLSYSGAWTATANDTFLHLSAGSFSGTGSSVVVFTYDQFLGTGTRTGTLTIAGLTLTVTQAGTNYIGPGGLTPLVTTGLNLPFGVGADGFGNVYIPDSSNNVVKEWVASTQQVIPLVSSGLNGPTGVAVDGQGSVYIADSGNSAIKEWVASTQQVITLVSSGLNGAPGVALDGLGNVYIADTGNGAIKEWVASTQQVITLFTPGLNGPTGVAVDGLGNVYVADRYNNAIYEWNPSTQQVTAPVSSGLNDPIGVAVDGSGNIYIADPGDAAVKEWSPATQQLTTLASSGLNNPTGVAVDGSGNVYVADNVSNAIDVIPYAFVGPASLTEPVSAGSDSLLPVLPTTAPLTGIFAPTSDQGWMTIGAISGGVINFSFTANTTGSSRVAHIALLGQQITVTQTGLIPQTITFGALSNQVYGTAPFTVSATASSGLVVSFTSTTKAVCTTSGNTVTLVAGGTCTIQATQAGNTTYAAAPPVNQSFQVTQASQTITFGALSNQPFSLTTITLTATASSGLSVSFASTTTGVCTVSGAAVTLVALGTCTIQASQAGNASYLAATVVNQSFQVTKGTQTITFGPLSNQPLGNPPFMVSATASSGLVVSFSSTTTAVCTVSGDTVTLVATGVCTIHATQAGNADYSAATPVNRSFHVQTSQTITFGALSNQAFGAAPFAVSATASSGLAVSFTSTTTSICTVSGSKVTLVALGQCTIQASQGGNANYAPATPVNQNFQVTQGSQAITFGAIPNKTYGVAPFTVNAKASSGLAVSFASTTTAVCTVSGNTVTLVAAGTCTIQATQAGDSNYAAATPVNQSFQVNQAKQTITFGALASQAFGTAPFTVTATASSGLPVSFAATTTAVCTVSGNTVTIVAAGTCTIQATQAGNNNYAAATPVNRNFQVTKASQTITFGALPNQVLGSAPFAVSATASSGLAVSFASKTINVCTVSGNTVTLVKTGTCAIQATQAGDADYSAAAPVSQSFQITP